MVWGGSWRLGRVSRIRVARSSFIVVSRESYLRRRSCRLLAPASLDRGVSPLRLRTSPVSVPLSFFHQQHHTLPPPFSKPGLSRAGGRLKWWLVDSLSFLLKK